MSGVRGRPKGKDSDRKTYFIGLRVNRETYLSLQEVLDSIPVSMSDYCRTAIENTIDRDLEYIREYGELYER